MSPLFKYLQENLSVDILISQEEKNKRKIIKVKEEKKEAKLKEVSISYDKEKFEVLALTLDINNIKQNSKITNLFPYFSNNKICSLTDAILFVKDYSKEERLYIFYIELKSEKTESLNILKKHLFMKKCVKHILDTFYIRNIVDSSKYKKDPLEFPKELYEGAIVFKIGNSKERVLPKIKYSNYSEIKDLKGKFFKKAVRYLWNLREKENSEIKLKSFFNEEVLEKSEYEIQNFLYKE